MGLSEKTLSAYLGDDGERVIFETRQHIVLIFGAVARIALALFVAIAAHWGIDRVGFLDNDFGLWLERAVYVAVLLYALAAAWRIIAWNAERLLISTHKVLHVEGVFNRKIASTPLVKIDELTVVQPLVGRMLGYGRLMVDNAGHGEEPLHGLGAIPDPGEVYRLITDNARAQRLIEGGHAEDGVAVATPRASSEASIDE